MAWRAEDQEAVTSIASKDIKWAQWLRVARGFQLRVGLKDRRRETFDGFGREVRVPVVAELRRILTSYGLFP